jgi:hypothetical protein
MENIENHLDGAILFINDHLTRPKTKTDRDKWLNILIIDIDILDFINNTKNKNIIIAILNVVEQLDHLFDTKEDKPAILISNTNSRRDYLPKNGDSLSALGIAFTH